MDSKQVHKLKEKLLKELEEFTFLEKRVVIDAMNSEVLLERDLALIEAQKAQK